MNHDERWSAIVSSHLRGLDLQELRFLLVTAIRASDSLAELAPQDIGNQLVVNGDIQLELSTLANVTGRLQQLLTSSPRRKGESEKRHQLRIRRVGWLRDEVFADIDLAVLDDRGVRNALEHFDDRLDELVERAADGRYQFPLAVVADIAVGHGNILAFLSGVADPPRTVEQIRTYVADEASVHVLRWSFSVGALATCCAEMLHRLNALQGLPATVPTDPVGAILIQTNRPAAGESEQ